MLPSNREFLSAARINPANADPLIGIGHTYLLRNDWHAAAQASVEAIRRDPLAAGALFNLGLSLFCNALSDLAEGALRTALSLEVKNGQEHLLLINTYLRNQKWDAALQHIEKHFKQIPAFERDRVSRIRATLRQADKPAGSLNFPFPILLGPTVRRGPCGSERVRVRPLCPQIRNLSFAAVECFPA